MDAHPPRGKPAIDVPLASSYWVVEGRLLAGEYPTAGADEQRRERLNALASPEMPEQIEFVNTWTSSKAHRQS